MIYRILLRILIFTDEFAEEIDDYDYDLEDDTNDVEKQTGKGKIIEKSKAYL